MSLENHNALTRILDAVECMEKCLSCAICLEISSDAAETRCGHLFCRNCIQKVLSKPGASCPVCKSNLTRRSISFSDQMGLVKLQLSDLVEMIRNDSGLDVTSCLKMHYKRRPFISMCSFSSDSAETEKGSKIVISKTNQESTKKAENLIHELNLSVNSTCNPITTRSKLQDIPTTRVSRSSRIQNKNDLPFEKSSKSAVEDPEMQEFDSLEGLVDKSATKRQQRMIDMIKADRDTNTQSRVAIFNKELLDKKAKLCDDVRNKSIISSSLEHSLERIRQDNLDHDKNNDMSLIKINNVNLDKTMKSIVEKPDLAKSAFDGNSIWPNNNQDMNLVTVKIPGEKVTSETVDPSKMKIGASGLDVRATKLLDSLKIINTPIRPNKRSSKELEKLTDASNNNLVDSSSTENIQIVPKKTNKPLNVGKPRTKQVQNTHIPSNVVRFKKLGHLFKTHRKIVTYLYLGKTKTNKLSDDLVGICKLCSSRIAEPVLKCKQNAPPIARLSRARSFEQTSLHQNQTENLAKNSKRFPLPSRIVDFGTKVESNRQDYLSENVSTSRIETIVANNCSENRELSTHKRNSLNTLNISKKRKRSESPDGNQKLNQQSEEDNRRNLDIEMSCAGVTEILEDCPLDTENLSQILSVQTSQTKRLHEMNTNDINEASERQNLAINFQGTTTLQEINTISKIRKSMETSQPNSVTITNESKIGNCVKISDLVGTETESICGNLDITQTPDLPKRAEACRGILSPRKDNCSMTRDVGEKSNKLFGSYNNVQNNKGELSEIEENNEGSEATIFHDSMMDITGEQEMLKNFEEDLFAPENIEKKQQDGGATEKQGQNGGATKKRGDDNVDDYELPNRSGSVVTTNLGPYNEPNENSIVSLTDIMFRSSREPSEISRIDDVVVSRPTAKIPKRNKENVTGEKKSIPRISRELKGARRQIQAPKNPISRPVYQSTPNPPGAYRNPRRANREEKQVTFSRFSKLENSRGFHGCILCSGLTVKQSADVKYLASLFNMEFTKKFSPAVSHVIVATNDDNNGACKTLKYLQGVAYRKWVLNFNWIVECVAQQKLVNEGIYEVVDTPTLIPGPRKARIGERAPFENFVFLCIEPIQNIPTSDYEDLLRQMGATIVRSLAELAAHKSILKIITLQADYHEKKIIEWHQITKAVPIAQEWVVECISQYRLISPVPFLQELVPQDVLDLGFPEAFIQDDNSDFMYDTFA